jgi:DNA double-strand break repair helicase HerA and related ATPase
MGPAQAAAMDAAVKASPRYAKYAQVVDRESAREKLAAKLEAGAAKQAEEARSKKEPKQPSSSRKDDATQDGGIVSDVVKSAAFKDFLRTAAREIARGMFKSGRR